VSTEPAEKLEDIQFGDAFFEITKAQDTISEESGELKRIVTGYAAVAEVIDSQFEIITREALESAAKDLLSYTTVLYNHDPDRPIGRVLEAKPQGNGLFVKVQISTTEDEIWNKITEGIISKFSFRGVVTDYAEKYEKSLDRYITEIKSFRIFEISLVSVPANPEAKTLHHYLSKALEHIKKESQTAQVTPEKTDETPNTGGPKHTMDQQIIVKSAERMKLIASLCDKLAAALQDMPQVDARLLALVKKIKAEAQAEMGAEEKYPAPQPAESDMDITSYDPVMEGVKSRMAGLEDKVAAVEKSLADLPASLAESITETVKGVTEELVNARITELDAKVESQSDIIKSFAELLDTLRPSLGLPDGQPIEKTEDQNPQGGET